jgi:hypothetical protein
LGGAAERPEELSVEPSASAWLDLPRFFERFLDMSVLLLGHERRAAEPGNRWAM